MTPLERITLAALLGSAALCAQSSIVSPIGAATKEGSSQDIRPFGVGDPHRYQQIHDDLPHPLVVPLRAVRGLAFRQNATGSGTSTGTLAIDLSLLMCRSVAYDHAHLVFADNYVGTPTTVIARKVLNLGPQGAMSTPGPNPFVGMQLTFDTPFVYDARLAPAILWEAAVFSTSVTGTFNAADAEQASMTTAVSTVVGTGCVASGQASKLSHRMHCADAAGTLVFGVDLLSGPLGAPAMLALGATNPSLTVPGLCGTVFTDLLVILPMGTVPPSGVIPSGTGHGFALPNAFAGFAIHTQAHALDAGRPDPIKITNSDGRRTVIPASDTSKIVRVTTIRNFDFGATNSTGHISETRFVGFGLVTRFDL